MGKLKYHRPLYFTFKEACALTKVKHSCVKKLSHNMSLRISQGHVSNIRKGLKETLDKFLLTYNHELKGIPLSYNHIKVTEARILDDSEWMRLDFHLDFLVFRPEKGKMLKGVVNKVTERNVGCIIHGCINGSIRQPDRSKLTHLQREVVDNISERDVVQFKIWKYEAHHGLIVVLGDFVGECYQNIVHCSQSVHKEEWEEEGNEVMEEQREKIFQVKTEPESPGEDMNGRKENGINDISLSPPRKKKRKKEKPNDSISDLEVTPEKKKTKSSPVNTSDSDVTPKKKKTKLKDNTSDLDVTPKKKRKNKNKSDFQVDIKREPVSDIED